MRFIKMPKTKINSLLIILYLFTPGLTIIPYSLIEHKIIYSFELILYIIILLSSILINWKQVNKKFLIMFIIFNSLFLLNIIIVDYERTVMKIYFTFFYSAIGSLYLVSKKIDWSFFLKSWYVVGITNIFIWFSLLDLVAEREISYMNLGTSLSFSFIIIFYRFYLKRKWYDLIFLSTVFTVIAIFGNRGALLAITLMMLIFLFYKSKYKKSIFSLGLLATTFMLTIDIKMLLINRLESIIVYLEEFNISTLSLRKITVVLKDGFSEGSTGRDGIYDKAVDIISDGFLPRGVGYFQEITNYVYPHNIFLDMLIIFGFFSIPIIIIVVMATIYYFYKETFYIRKDVVLMLLVVSLTRLSLSSTFLQEISLWLMIGLMILSRTHYLKEEDKLSFR